MAFSRMAYTPATGLKDTTTFPTTPASEDAARKQIQDMFDQVTTNVNALIDALEDDTSGSSGAENTGSKAIPGVEVSEGISAVTVYDQIVAVKAIADSASAGLLTAGSISNSNMFGADVVTQTAIADDAVGADQLAANSVVTASIVDDAVTQDKIADDAVGADQLADNAVATANIQNLSVTEGKIGAGAVTQTKIGDAAVGTAQLGTVQTITLDTGDTITYNTTNNQLELNVSGCTKVYLCPMIYGTDATPPAGTYPKGTVYFQHAV